MDSSAHPAYFQHAIISHKNNIFLTSTTYFFQAFFWLLNLRESEMESVGNSLEFFHPVPGPGQGPQHLAKWSYLVVGKIYVAPCSFFLMFIS